MTKSNRNLNPAKMTTAILLLTLLLSFSYATTAHAVVKGEMGFIEIAPVEFKFKKNWRSTHHKSATNRLWYTYFRADENHESKPLFVFLNGGPGCGTSMNLFAMNTAPYTLDRSKVAENEQSAINEYSWTKLGNLLYIDAPNAGFSYMLCDDGNIKDDSYRLKEFIFGDNYNAFIDAAQVIRCLLTFLEKHSDIQKNEVIFVGESYSGVRVTTMLNMLLFYKEYNGDKVYEDKALVNLIENHFNTVLGKNPPYIPEDIAAQFKKQVLIQPQIVDCYQGIDKVKAFMKSDSLMDQLGSDSSAKMSWRDFLKMKNLSKSSKTSDLDSAITEYLLYINRDKYNYSQEWSWSDDNEYFAMETLDDIDELTKITGGCDPRNVPFFLPENRKNALRFALNAEIPINASHTLILLEKQLPSNIRMYIDMIPFWQQNLLNMDNPINTLSNKLGQLNDFDSYLVGTNPYIFLGFCMNNGGNSLLEVLIEARYDTYDISPGCSDIYGEMFLDNVSLIDTFMTDALYDAVVYSPTLVSQFQKKRFKKQIKKITVSRGNAEKRDGSFTIFYKRDSVNGIGDVPDERTVSWYYYGKSGHSVSSTQPEEFRNDVESWLSLK